MRAAVAQQAQNSGAATDYPPVARTDDPKGGISHVFISTFHRGAQPDAAYISGSYIRRNPSDIGLGSSREVA